MQSIMCNSILFLSGAETLRSDGGKNFIFDLDGTLIDSYGVILSSVSELLQREGIVFEREVLKKTILRSSLGALFEELASGYGLSLSYLNAEYRRVSAERQTEICQMPNALETLRGLYGKNRLFVYTHRGVTTRPVLKRLGMDGFFEEVVTSENGFPRKPSPDALDYLIGKHALDREKTYYVGDRTLDAECASGASVKSVLYLPKDSVVLPSGKENYVVSDLKELLFL